MPGRRRLVAAALVATVLVVGVGALLVAMSADDDAPTGSLATALAAARSASAPFVGLTEVDVSVGGTCQLVVVADERGERVQGLRGVTDLGRYDGMLFLFDTLAASRFTMADTLIALDIGFYRPDGGLIESLAMVPCPEDALDCPTYGPEEPFLLALETPTGELASGALSGCG